MGNPQAGQKSSNTLCFRDLPSRTQTYIASAHGGSIIKSLGPSPILGQPVQCSSADAALLEPRQQWRDKEFFTYLLRSALDPNKPTKQARSSRDRPLLNIEVLSSHGRKGETGVGKGWACPDLDTWALNSVSRTGGQPMSLRGAFGMGLQRSQE